MKYTWKHFMLHTAAVVAGGLIVAAIVYDKRTWFERVMGKKVEESKIES